MRLFLPLFALFGLAAVSAAPATKPASGVPAALFDENVLARVWRTALVNATGGEYPQYTFPNATAEGTIGEYERFSPKTWTSGFFPAELWQLYRRFHGLCPSGNASASSSDTLPDVPSSAQDIKNAAQVWTRGLQSNTQLTSTHDVGFLSYPFVDDLNLAGNASRKADLADMGNNLAARYVPVAGVIRSWDNSPMPCSGGGSCPSHNDSVLVIIDNMMNLELLLQSAADYTGNQTHKDIAISHADKTMQNHVRPDGSSFHVVDYSGTTGQVYLQRTAQGLADDSTWSRGQGWGVYGFAMMYNYTGLDRYRETSVRMADWYLAHLPPDGVPYWDFNAPQDPSSTPRDTSSATLTSSGLLLLSSLLATPPPSSNTSANSSGSIHYRDAALSLLNATIQWAEADEITLAQAATPAEGSSVGLVGRPGAGFEAILAHGTVNNNANATPQVKDVGIVYGDYYFIEAGNQLLSLGIASCPTNAASRNGSSLQIGNAGLNVTAPLSSTAPKGTEHESSARQSWMGNGHLNGAMALGAAMAAGMWMVV